MASLRYIDLFCGIGGFHVAAKNVSNRRGISMECVFASDIDVDCQKVYKHNFGIDVVGDITTYNAKEVPDHDILFAGFPCQPFSIIGSLRGFEDTRGTLFFDIARILEAKKPSLFVLENVKMLVGHRKGQTLARITETLYDLGYQVSWRVLNALDFGLPQKRERVFIVGFREPASLVWPHGGLPMRPLSEILEKDVDPKFFASEQIRLSRSGHHEKSEEPTIWHENKSGNVSKYPYSCALRAGASYNYLLVDGERRLTEREMLRLQGFPEHFQILGGYSAVRRQAGNSVAIPVVEAVIERVLDAKGVRDCSISRTKGGGQFEMVMER